MSRVDTKRARLVIVVGAALMSALVVAGYAQAQTGGDRRQQPFTHRPLVNASTPEIGQYAIDLAYAQVRVNGTPRVRLVRRVDGAGLEAVGLDRIGFVCGERPLVLVILEGDFDTRAALGGGTAHDQFIVYVFDALTGALPFSRYSPTGMGLGPALGDPRLPDPPAIAPRPSPVPEPSPVQSARHPSCDQPFAPPLTPPGNPTVPRSPTVPER